MPVVTQSNAYVDDVVVDESRSYVDVTIRLDNPNTDTATIGYYSNYGTAGSSDFDSVNSSVTFAAGETEKTVRIILNPDNIAEGDEVFYLSIDNPSDNITIADPYAEIRIAANDAATGTPVASVSSMVIDEAQRTATFVISLDRPSAGVVRMDYATQNGTATAGSDYTAAAGSLVFAAGETVKTVTVDITNDSAAEANEAFKLALSNLSGATSLVPNGTATIWANDAPAVAQSNAFVDDVVVDESRSYVDVTIRLDRPNTDTATIGYYSNYGTAGSSDFDSVNSFVTFAAGETEKTVRIILNPDNIAEGDEVFYLSIDNPSDNITIADPYAEIRIAANDAATGTPVASVSSMVVDEAQRTATFVISLDRPSAGVVRMDYATQNGTAIAGSDYTAAAGSLVFAAGETVKTVTVDITNDSVAEANEAFKLALSNLSGATSLVPNGTATIWANDAPAVAQSNAFVDDVVVDESRSYVDVTIRLDRPNTDTATIGYYSNYGTAGSSDFDSVNSFVTFAAGETEKTVRIILNPDNIAEGDEVFYLSIDNPSDNITIADPYAEIRIAANDAATGTPVASVSSMVVDEAQRTATFVISLDRPSAGVVQMDYATQNGTAIAGSDYTAATGSLVFVAGETVKTVTVDITNDNTAEANEAFKLALSNLSGATSLVPNGTATIWANDAPAVAQSNAFVDDVVVDESRSYVDVTIRLDRPNTDTATIGYYSNYGTAGSSDFDSVNSFVTFAAGETEKTVRIILDPDSVAEGDEVFYLSIDNPSDNITIADPYAEIRIAANDAATGTPVASVSSMVVDEAQRTATFVVSLDRPSAGVVRMDYATQNGTATAGSDYTAATGSLVFAAGETVKTVTVDITNDSTAEANEAFKLALSNLSGATSLVPNGTATIWANDAPAVAQSNAFVDDVVVDESRSYVDVTIRLDRPNTDTATIGYYSNYGTAGSSDFDSVNSFVTFAAGETEKTVRIILDPDSVAEGDEVFYLSIDNPSDNITIADPYAEIRIAANDAATGTPVASVSSMVVDEAQRTATFVISLDRPSAGVVQMDYATQNGTAIAGSDYTAATGSLVFVAGETVKTVTVDITNDSVAEANEAFQLALSNLSGATSSQPLGAAVIAANDAGAVVGPVASVGNVATTEGDAFVDFVVKLDRPSTETVTIGYYTNYGTAGSSDFGSVNSFVTFAPGETTKTVRVITYQDTATEGSETFTLRLTNPDNATISATGGVATATIVDDEGSAGTTVTAASAGDVIRGSEFGDTLTGSGGDDFLDGGAGADTLTGGAGNDTYLVDNAGDRVIETSGQGTDVVLSAIDFNLTGQAIENLVLIGTAINGTGNELANRITGNAANNAINGGTGADTLIGGLGNDTYFVDNAGDAIVENAGEGTDTVRTTVTYSLAGTQAEYLLLTGADAINGTGNDLANRITGNAANNVLNGGLGADTLIGGLGNDTYFVDNAGDVVTENAGEGIDTVRATITYSLAGTQADYLLLSGTAAINGTGNDFANRITGNAANNVLNGGIGADTLIGGAGNDTYYVDNAGDLVTENAGEGIDTVRATITYSLAGTQADYLLLTGTAAINGTGNDLANRIIGNGANNILNGGIGADTLTGGLGNDTYFVDNAGDVIVENAGEGIDTVRTTVTYSLAGTQADYLLLTGAGAIDGTGNDLANRITGNAANNVLNGGIGADTLAGGLGNDTYYVDNVGDVVTENAGEGIDTVRSTITYSLDGTQADDLLLGGTAAINGTGNDLANHITGNAANNILNGGVGADTLTGGLGNDTYYVDNAGDVVTENAGEGIDTVRSTITYSLAGTQADYLVLSGASAINGTGNDLANRITGNAANNILNGGIGADTLTGGLGNDTYFVDNAGDRIVENAGEGIDTVRSSVNFSLANTQLENLLLSGTAVTATGNDLANSITGNAANNFIDGGLGADILRGGTGLDIFLFDTALGSGNVDNLADFVVADDTIRLDRTIFSGLSTNGTLAAGAFVTGSAAVDADDRILYEAATGKLFYDADGNGAGAAVLFATTAANLTLTNADFFVVP